MKKKTKIIKFKDEHPNKFESIKRKCETCGVWIKKGDFIHKCDEKKIKNIERGKKAAETRLDNYGVYTSEEISIDDAYKIMKEMVDPEYADFEEEGF